MRASFIPNTYFTNLLILTPLQAYMEWLFSFRNLNFLWKMDFFAALRNDTSSKNIRADQMRIKFLFAIILEKLSSAAFPRVHSNSKKVSRKVFLDSISILTRIIFVISNHSKT